MLVRILIVMDSIFWMEYIYIYIYIYMCVCVCVCVCVSGFMETVSKFVLNFFAWSLALARVQARPALLNPGGPTSRRVPAQRVGSRLQASSTLGLDGLTPGGWGGWEQCVFTKKNTAILLLQGSQICLAAVCRLIIYWKSGHTQARWVCSDMFYFEWLIDWLKKWPISRKACMVGVQVLTRFS